MQVSQLVPAVVAGEAMDAMLTYSPLDPYAVRLDIGGARWMFARELLIAPLNGQVSQGLFVGIGDVGACLDGATFLIRLESPSGRAVIELPSADVACFVRLSLAACPYGSESIFAAPSLAREIDAILS